MRRILALMFLVAVALLPFQANATSSDDIKQIGDVFAKLGTDRYKHEFGPYPDRDWKSYYSVSKRKEGGVRLGFVRKHEKGDIRRNANGDLQQMKPLHWLPVGDTPFSPNDKGSVIFDFSADGKLVEASFNDEYYDAIQQIFIEAHTAAVLDAAAHLLQHQASGGPRPQFGLCEKYLIEVLTGLFDADSDLGIHVCAK
jgi:hypothetical protein